jgi:hypothetical protein
MGFIAPSGSRPGELAAQRSVNGSVWHTQYQFLYIGGAAVRMEPDGTQTTGQRGQKTLR